MTRDENPRGRLRAAWTLALLTTLCAELTFTAVAVPFAWVLLPLLLVMYGAGVLLVREAVVRTGGGWPSLVLLGLAYQLAEDGLGLQALTSPNIYGAADWGWRALGANWSYWASQVGVHVVFSVLLPVLLTDLVFPDRRGRPYLRTGGLVGVGLLAVLGVVGLRVVISGTEDPGYLTPWGWTVGFVLAIAALAVLALRVVPGYQRLAASAPRHATSAPRSTESPRRRAAPAPRPLVVAVALSAGTVVFLGLLIPPGLGPETLFDDAVPPAVLLTAAALVGVGLAGATLRWSAAPGWSDRHRIWLAGGILVGHTAFMMPGPPANAVTGAVTIALEVLLLTLLARKSRSTQSLRPKLT